LHSSRQIIDDGHAGVHLLSNLRNFHAAAIAAADAMVV